MAGIATKTSQATPFIQLSLFVTYDNWYKEIFSGLKTMVYEEEARKAASAFRGLYYNPTHYTSPRKVIQMALKRITLDNFLPDGIERACEEYGVNLDLSL